MGERRAELQSRLYAGSILFAGLFNQTLRELPMEGPRVVLVLFLLMVLLSSPGTQRPSQSQQRALQTIVEEGRQGWSILNQTQQGDFNSSQNSWLNITGLRAEDGYAWDLLPQVQAKAREQAQAVLGTTQIRSGRTSVYSLPHGHFGERYSSVENLDGGEKLPVVIPFYQNVTGLIHGQWLRSRVRDDFEVPKPNLTAISPVQYITKEFNRNITGARGELSIKLDQKESTAVQVGLNTAREIKAELTIQDKSSSGDGWEMVLHGIQFVESGAILLTTSGEKFAGIFALPHLVRSDATFDAAQQLLNETVLAAINRQESSDGHPNYPWASSQRNPAEVMFPTPHCEYLVYLQQHFVWPGESGIGWSSYLRKAWDQNVPEASPLGTLENELRAPTGAPLNFIPELRFSAVIFSPDCGFVLESEAVPDSWYHNPGRHLKGLKAEAYLKTVRRAIEVFCLVVAAQILLLMRQMKDASTPSTKSRISYGTVAMMALGDGFAFLSCMVLSLLMDSAFLTVVTTAFLAFLCVSFFGMKFLMDIWSVQAPERQEGERQRQRQREQQASVAQRQSQNTPGRTPARTTPTANTAAAGADTLPLPATTRQTRDTGATPVILPPDQDIEADAAEENAPATGQRNTQITTLGSARREMGQMYSRFYFLLIGLIFLSLNASTWPVAIRSIYTNALALLYLSFWTPQIKRNIVRNCRKALRWEFVFGQSILRLTPFVYFYGYEGNVLFAKSDRNMLFFFAAWLWAQILLLLSQEILGPRFFVPSGWAPPAYDYHPILREDDEEAGSSMPIGFTQTSAAIGSPVTSPGESKERGKWSFDCAICMHSLEVPVVPRSGTERDSSTSTSLGANLFTRRAYMVTPCRHIFHSICLEGWMKYKLQCPICRESLPPL
ncbi:MAG: hypothetical protein LQ340_004647 [Diploschistes diacapsis]|nr:MAG: hypothetical protein LQ340_004647 [Diploschistes diacapsis]